VVCKEVGMKVLVVGARRSGVYASLLAKAKGFDVFLTEKNDNEDIRSFERILRENNIPFEFGGHSFERFGNFDLAVLSPGIPMSAPIVSYLKKHRIKIIGELEFAYMFAPNTTVIAITGTNGKSTTTALIGHIFKNYNKNTVVGGNLGTPYAELLLENPAPTYSVLETSCFQLETIEQYHPEVSVFLNFSENHLDRYNSVDEYLETKKRIFMNQTVDDFAVLNYDDPVVRNLEKEIKPRAFFFSTKREVIRGSFLLSSDIFFKKEGGEKCFILKKSDIKLIGMHNVENVLASITVSMLLGIPIPLLRESIQTFRGLPHRLEFVREVNGVTYINDSKSTTPDAAVKALDSFERKVILIAGGSSKNNNFKPLARRFKDRVKFLVLMGQTAEEIRRAAVAEGFETYAIAKSLKDAVHLASSVARVGDIVLLSPACASFDMFRDFEDRGEQFKDIVNAL